MTFCAFDPRDGGGKLGHEEPVIGGLGRQLANGAQPDVDGGRCETPGFERGAVALHRRFIVETLGGVGAAPLPEVIERLAIGATGVSGRAGLIVVNTLRLRLAGVAHSGYWLRSIRYPDSTPWR